MCGGTWNRTRVRSTELPPEEPLSLDVLQEIQAPTLHQTKPRTRPPQTFEHRGFSIASRNFTTQTLKPQRTFTRLLPLLLPSQTWTWTQSPTSSQNNKTTQTPTSSTSSYPSKISGSENYGISSRTHSSSTFVTTRAVPSDYQSTRASSSRSQRRSTS
jgi:hypothetical protein